MTNRVVKWRQYIEQHPAAVNDARLLLDEPESAQGGWWTGTTLLIELVDGAIRPGHPHRMPLINLILEMGADPNAADAYGRTALHLACSTDTRDEVIVEVLVRHGASPNIADNGGRTAWDVLQNSAGDEAERIRAMLR